MKWPDHIGRIICDDCLTGLRSVPDNVVHCVVTSPPYWGLRDYGVDGQLGLEGTPEEYIGKMVEIFREVRRVLRDDGTCWLNLGDSYWGGKGKLSQAWSTEHQDRETLQKSQHQICTTGETRPQDGKHDTIKPKDLCGIPWRVALALQADGWYLRSDVIWCLSGGTHVYAKTQKGEMPMTIKDLYRLKPETVQLWNGKRWTQLLGMNKNHRAGDELEIVLRSGERISCTPTHKFPTKRGLLEASELRLGDILKRVRLPQPEHPRDCAIDHDAAWFAGLYLAEGSRSGSCIQIAGHVKESSRWRAVTRIAAKYGGSATRTINGNKMDIRVYGKVLNAIIDELVSGRTAHDKCFAPVVWQYSNDFVDRMLAGYMSGDGHYDEKNGRYRLGFCRNYNLERDLRTACARLGFHLTLKMSHSKCNEKSFPSFRGEMRFTLSDHRNKRSRNEIVEIRKSRCRYVYDLGVADDPHTFALASGILTHNSKPNPMPESVTDRPTKAHEYIFLLTKSARYFYDNEAVKESTTAQPRTCGANSRANCDRDPAHQTRKQDAVGSRRYAGFNDRYDFANPPTGRNLRTVWSIATEPYPEAHFATFPRKIPMTCIRAGTSERGVCPECGAPWERVVEKDKSFESGSGRSGNPIAGKNGPDLQGGGDTGDIRKGPVVSTTTTGWEPTCSCGLPDTVGAIVLDPFMGSGTTMLVAREMGRRAFGFELNPGYVGLANKRNGQEVLFQ